MGQKSLGLGHLLQTHHTMNRRAWCKLLDKLPPGLKYYQVARRLNRPYNTVITAMLRYGYRAVDGRHTGQLNRRKLDPAKVDWTLPTPELRRRYKVSRQRLWVVRKNLGQ